MTRRVSKKHNHSIKIKAKGERFALASTLRGDLPGRHALRGTMKEGGRSPVRARGSRSQQWYAENRVQMLRKKCRTQSLWNLHLAGDWHVGSETMPLGARPHMMRCLVGLENVVSIFISIWFSGVGNVENVLLCG